MPSRTPDAGPGRRWRPARAVIALRRHWLLALLLAAGLGLRAAAVVAYRPALLYIDSLKYLYSEYPGSDPLGYKVLLRIILAGGGGLGTVAVLQHLLGLAMAVTLHAVLVRRGAPRWLAALAVAPVLLDAYQLQMEQTIMPDVWFEAMLVAGLAVLLWRPRPTLPGVLAAGLILGASATVRQVGEVLILPAALYLLAGGGGWRLLLRQCAALAVAFALPILCYCAASWAVTGHFWLSAGQSHTGRLAAAADCATLRLPAAAAPAAALCPTPAQQARGPDWLEHAGASPLHATALPRGSNRGALIAALDSAVQRQQPAAVLGSVARDSVRLFALTRGPTAGVTPISRWQFQAGYPTYVPQVRLGAGNVIIVGVQARAYGLVRFSPLPPADGGPARVDRPVAAFLRSYQLDGGYTPGPLLALCVLAGLAGSLLALRRGAAGPARQLALASLLLTLAAAGVLLVPDVYEFSWRYQLPALVTLVPAGALGWAALLSRRREPGFREPGLRKHRRRRARARPQAGGRAPEEGQDQGAPVA